MIQRIPAFAMFWTPVLVASLTLALQASPAYSQVERPRLERPAILPLKAGPVALAVAAIEEVTEERENPAREGAVYLFSKQVLVSSVIELSNARILDPMQRLLGFGPEAHNSRDVFGFASVIADFDEDGRPDLVIANPGAGRPPNNQRPGLIHYYVMTDGVYEHRQTLRKGFQRELGLPGLLGWSLIAADFNNDGHRDVIAGAPGHPHPDDIGSGAIFVYPRRPVFPDNFQGPIFTPQALLITGEDLVEGGTQTLFGSALGYADFNGDGLDDLIVGAPLAADDSGTTAGALFAYHGNGTGQTPVRRLDQSGFSPNEAGDHLGAAIAVADFDGDGFADAAVAAPQEDLGADLVDAGLILIYSGGDEGLQAQSVLDPRDRSMDPSHSLFGTRLATGDFDGDGRADLAVSAPLAKSVPARDLSLVDRGRRVLETTADALRQQNRIARMECLDRLPVPGRRRSLPDHCFVVDLPRPSRPGRVAIPKETGLVFIYRGTEDGLVYRQTLGAGDERQLGQQFGIALNAQDLNGDGYTDLVVGAAKRSVGQDDSIRAGAAFVFVGSADGFSLAQTLTQKGLDFDEDGDLFGAALNN